MRIILPIDPIIYPIENIWSRLYWSFQQTTQGSSMFRFSVFRPTSCLLCAFEAFEQYLFVRFHNLDSLYRSANVFIIKECIIDKTIYHPLSLFSFRSPNTHKGPENQHVWGNLLQKKGKYKWIFFPRTYSGRNKYPGQIWRTSILIAYT